MIIKKTSTEKMREKNRSNDRSNPFTYPPIHLQPQPLDSSRAFSRISSTRRRSTHPTPLTFIPTIRSIRLHMHRPHMRVRMRMWMRMRSMSIPRRRPLRRPHTNGYRHRYRHALRRILRILHLRRAHTSTHDSRSRRSCCCGRPGAGYSVAVLATSAFKRWWRARTPCARTWRTALYVRRRRIIERWWWASYERRCGRYGRRRMWRGRGRRGVPPGPLAITALAVVAESSIGCIGRFRVSCCAPAVPVRRRWRRRLARRYMWAVSVAWGWWW